MSTSRKRNPLAIAGRLTAVTLSVALLAGCTGARFMMGGDPAPVNPTGVAPATPNQAWPMISVTGKASLLGVPMANATVKVFDALTNAPAAVIAAGGANYAVQQTAGRPPLQVGAPSVTTDDQGNFSLSLGNFRPGMAARIVVTVGGKTLTTLVSGSGQALSSTAANAYAVAQTPKTSNDFSDLAGLDAALKAKVDALLAKGLFTGIDEVTHAKTQVLWPYNRIGSILDLQKSTSFIDNGFDQVNAWSIPFVEAAKRAGIVDCDDTGRPRDLNSFSEFTKSTGLDNQLNSLVTNGQKTIAQIASQNPSSILGNVNLTQNDLAGSDLKATLTNGQLSLTNEKTGETTTVTLPTGPDTNNPPTTQEPTTQEPTQQETSAGPNETQVDISNTGAFNPTVTVSGNLTVTVQQPSGTDDISAIYARIPTAGTTLTAANIASQTTGNITAGPQAAALTVAVDNAPDADGNLPPRFASAPLSGRVFAGHLMRGTQKVATFRVYTMGSFHYLVTKYLLTDSVKTNGGHTTSVTTTAITGVATGTKAEITLVSRNGNFANIEKNTQ